MEYRVKLHNQARSFIVQAPETLLAAAIRAGMALNYGCSSGTCGLCKVRLLKGDIKEVHPHEFVIPESEKLQGNILACVCSARSDLEIDALLAHHVADIPQQSLTVKVRKVEQLARQVYRLILQTPRTKRLRFLAGQYAKISCQDAGAGTFSIASCPCEDRLIEFHVRVSEQAAVWRRAVEKMRLGDELTLTGPYGDFVYDEQAGRAVILFAFDTGFAAIKSLLEHITAQEQELHMHLIWMACGQEGLYMRNLCRAWMDAFDHFNFSAIALDKSIQQMMDNPQQSCTAVEEHLTGVMADYTDLGGHDVYVSAPAPAGRLFEKVCRQKNLLPARFFTEPVRGNEDMSCIASAE